MIFIFYLSTKIFLHFLAMLPHLMDGFFIIAFYFFIFSCFHIIWYLRWLCVYCISNDQSVDTHINKSVADSLLRVCRVDFLASIVCVITKSVYPDLIPPLLFWNWGGGGPT